MRPAVLVLALVACLGALDASALTVEEAYAAIPHQRTVFDGNASRLTRAQVASLQQLFALCDKGTVLRVEAMRAVQAANLQELRRAISDYRVLIDSVNALNVPAEIKPVQQLVSEALQDHQRFFQSRLEQDRALAKRDLAFTAEVQRASRELRRAYDVLMRTFPNEPAVNKAAFYDYLCALDFL